MNKKIVDVVNVNSDASCLDTKWWFKMLKGGEKSYFFNWLNIYVKLNKKVSMGFTGATIADMAMFNPESIKLINDNKQIFEIILRPFSHDIGLLRNKRGFEFNLDTGIKTIVKEFGEYTSLYLPPEFMLTNKQIYLLNKHKVSGTFINANRFKNEIKTRLPKKPYFVKGLRDTNLKCIPINGDFTTAYLHGIHHFNADKWNNLALDNNEISFSWRDGESSFFVPDGNIREETWLKKEDKTLERVFLKDILSDLEFEKNEALSKRHYHHYPIHSFNAWMKEFRMMGFVQKVADIEKRLKDLTLHEKYLWLQTINSDILSSVEKDSPKIKLMLNEKDTEDVDYTIWRAERGVEGEEYLFLFNDEHVRNDLFKHLDKLVTPATIKLKNRLQYLNQF